MSVLVISNSDFLKAAKKQEELQMRPSETPSFDCQHL